MRMLEKCHQRRFFEKVIANRVIRDLQNLCSCWIRNAFRSLGDFNLEDFGKVTLELGARSQTVSPVLTQIPKRNTHLHQFGSTAPRFGDSTLEERGGGRQLQHQPRGLRDTRF